MDLDTWTWYCLIDWGDCFYYNDYPLTLSDWEPLMCPYGQFISKISTRHQNEPKYVNWDHDDCNMNGFNRVEIECKSPTDLGQSTTTFTLDEKINATGNLMSHNNHGLACVPFLTDR